MTENVFRDHIELDNGRIVLDRTTKPEGTLHGAPGGKAFDLPEPLGRANLDFFMMGRTFYGRLYSWKFNTTVWYVATFPKGFVG